MTAWLHAFLLTQVVEVPIYARALRDRTVPASLALAFGASLLTHPAVWFVVPALIGTSYVSMVVVAETFAVLAEAAYLRALGVRRALRWSLLANTSSVVVGFLLRWAVGWP